MFLPLAVPGRPRLLGVLVCGHSGCRAGWSAAPGRAAGLVRPVPPRPARAAGELKENNLKHLPVTVPVDHHAAGATELDAQPAGGPA